MYVNFLKEHGYLVSGNKLANKEHGCLFFDDEGTDTKWPANGTGEGEREGIRGLTRHLFLASLRLRWPLAWSIGNGQAEAKA